MDQFDLYDYKSSSVTSHLPCDIPSYIKLITMCFNPKLTAPLIAAMVRSIAIHHFTHGGEYVPPAVNVDNQLSQLTEEDLREVVDALITLGKIQQKDTRTLGVQPRKV